MIIDGTWTKANEEQAELRFARASNCHWVLEYDTGEIGYYDTTHRKEIFKTANEAIETGEKYAFKKRFHLRKVILK
jgi:hypothetical protein